MSEMIKHYTQETEWTTAGSGTAKWCTARGAGDKKVFIKSFLEITLVSQEMADIQPPPMVQAQREACVRFRQQKERLYQKLNDIQNGFFVVPQELITYKGHFCSVAALLESTHASDTVYRLPERRRVILMRSLIAAMRELEENHIVHSDIKADNVVITYNAKGIPQLKIIDFDSGFFEDDPPRAVHDFHGDQVYFAPESMIFMQNEEADENIPLTCAIDKFAVGILLHQMWCGQLPAYDHEECMNVAEALLLEMPVKLHDSIPEELRKIIAGFLHSDPKERLDYREAYDWLKILLDKMPDDKPEDKPILTEIEIQCVADKKLLHSQKITLSAGTRTTIRARSFEGYECLSDSQEVSIDAEGRAYPSTLIFNYRKQKKAHWKKLVIAFLLFIALWVVCVILAHSAYAKGNWETAITIGSYCPCYDIFYPGELNTAQYQYGVTLYQDKAFPAAAEQFKRTQGDFKYRDDYLTLCKAHMEESEYWTEELIDEMIDLVGFEDADQLLLSDFTSFSHLMMGTWMVYSGDKNNDSAFEMHESDGSIYLDAGSVLTHGKSGKWTFKDGCLSYSYDNGGQREDEYQITIVGKNEVVLKNSTTHRVHVLRR